MKTLSLKLDEDIFGDTEKVLAQMKKPRNRYINEAIEYYNKLHLRVMMEQKLKEESQLVSADSMNILKEFEAIDEADQAI